MTAVDPRFLANPANFLHAIDVDRDRAFFVPTSTEALRSASFVDGRIPIATSEVVETPLSDVVSLARNTSGVDRYLFNCSFCGSTLLSRLLDRPGRSLVLKEPRSLTDLASWKTYSLRDGKSVDRLPEILKFTRFALRRRFSADEAVTIKVGNHGNALLDDLITDPARVRPVFITIGRLDFLRAVFRGGSARMHHAAQTAWSMAVGSPDGDALLKEAMGAGKDPLRKAANLAILARFFQVRKFRKLAKKGNWDGSHVVDYSTISLLPHRAAETAAKALDLPLDDNDIDQNLLKFVRRDAKSTDKPFSADRQDAEDNRLHAEHRLVFEDALGWADKTLGAPVTVAGD